MLYGKIVLTIALLAGMFGYAIPTMISTPDTIFVIAGFLVVALTPYLIYNLWSDYLGKISTTQEESGEGDSDAPKS